MENLRPAPGDGVPPAPTALTPIPPSRRTSATRNSIYFILYKMRPTPRRVLMWRDATVHRVRFSGSGRSFGARASAVALRIARAIFFRLHNGGDDEIGAVHCCFVETDCLGVGELRSHVSSSRERDGSRSASRSRRGHAESDCTRPRHSANEARASREVQRKRRRACGRQQRSDLARDRSRCDGVHTRADGGGVPGATCEYLETLVRSGERIRSRAPRRRDPLQRSHRPAPRGVDREVRSGRRSLEGPLYRRHRSRPAQPSRSHHDLGVGDAGARRTRLAALEIGVSRPQ